MAKKEKYRVLIEAGKLMEADGDGVKRYLIELLSALSRQADKPAFPWEIDLFIYGDIVSLRDYREFLDIRIAQRNFGLLSYEKPLLRFKKLLQTGLPDPVYEPLADIYRKLPVRPVLQIIKTSVKAVQRSIRPLQKDPRMKDYDLIHLPLPQHEDVFAGLDVPVLITVHDLTHRLFPEFHQARNIRLAEKGFRFAQEANARFIAVSEATRLDLIREMKISPEKIDRVYEAADAGKFSPADELSIRKVCERYGLQAGKYFLALSTIEPRKNLKRSIEAFLQMREKHPGSDIRMVIAGKSGWKIREALDRDAKKYSEIVFTGFVPEEDLPPLYSGALALSFASLYEGFGLPALEAMQCGTSVIYGNRGALPEIVADAGISVDPLNKEEIVEAMVRIATDHTLRDQLRKRATERAQQFDWDRCARETLESYLRTLSKKEASCE